MRTRARRFMYSPLAPRIIAEKITELAALALASLTVWLCFGGPVSALWSTFMVFCNTHVAGSVL